MESLNLPAYSFNIKSERQRNLIFDEIRKKYVPLTPEEWVRQHFVKYLINEKKYPAQLIAVEMFLKHNKMKRRCDIVIFDKSGRPLLITECKAPSVKISREAFEQLAVYNLKLLVSYLIVTNGIDHYCCKMDGENRNPVFLKEIPEYRELIS
ncbi:MAG: type I restriction enzyme HsdR N-terminal domain-containing protein [Bacteroidia bacterium]|nr:type I restriction enzyme HsdR N-terminal domain-containing protein [Bacteroidia bacterium]